MNVMKPPAYRPVETVYDFLSTECVVTHSVDKMVITATMQNDLYETLKATPHIK